MVLDLIQSPMIVLQSMRLLLMPFVYSIAVAVVVGWLLLLLLSSTVAFVTRCSGHLSLFRLGLVLLAPSLCSSFLVFGLGQQ